MQMKKKLIINQRKWMKMETEQSIFMNFYSTCYRKSISKIYMRILLRYLESLIDKIQELQQKQKQKSLQKVYLMKILLINFAKKLIKIIKEKQTIVNFQGNYLCDFCQEIVYLQKIVNLRFSYNQSVNMEQFLTEGHSDITFTTEESKNEDHIDRALRNLRELQRQNDTIRKQMQKIKGNPKAFIKPMRDDLCNKINQLREENDSLRRIVQKSKIPAYCQMTKKKIISTEYEQRLSTKQSMRGSLRNRNPLDQIESNVDKNDSRSTCLNYQTNQTENQNRAYIIGPNDQQERQTLARQIRVMLDKAEQFESQLQKLQKAEKNQAKTTNKRDSSTQQELYKIYQYKKKLIKLLNKLKNRQIAIKELIQTYRQMYEQTLCKLKDANQVLERLRQAKISEDIDQKYAEVLELQQRLNRINHQLQEMDQSKWLQQIARQLVKAVRRMGLQIPKFQSNRQLIDELCAILIQSHITTRKDGQAKLALLKQYHEEEKKNNSQYVLALKAKQQALGRKLIDLQMDK